MKLSKIPRTSPNVRKIVTTKILRTSFLSDTWKSMCISIGGLSNLAKSKHSKFSFVLTHPPCDSTALGQCKPECVGGRSCSYSVRLPCACVFRFYTFSHNPTLRRGCLSLRDSKILTEQKYRELGFPLPPKRYIGHKTKAVFPLATALKLHFSSILLTFHILSCSHFILRRKCQPKNKQSP